MHTNKSQASIYKPFTHASAQARVRNQVPIQNFKAPGFESRAAYLLSIHQNAMTVARELNRHEFLMIEALQSVDQNKVHRFLKCKNLTQYAQYLLKLSPHQMYFITVARKAIRLDKLQLALKNKEISVSQAKRIVSVVDDSNVEEWLTKAKVMTQKQLERAVAKSDPKTLVMEGTRYLDESTLELKAAISESTDQLLRRVQEIESQKKNNHASYDDTLKAMARAYLEKHDPVAKAQRAIAKKLKQEHRVKQKMQRSPEVQKRQKTLSLRRVLSQESNQSVFVKRRPLLAQTKHRVVIRDQDKCQGLNPDGSPCLDSKWTDIHHIIPISQGGTNTIENLITLCKGHHQLEHWVT
jgi:5-methylcytosine-specific restriction endonuclease McrA